MYIDFTGQEIEMFDIVTVQVIVMQSSEDISQRRRPSQTTPAIEMRKGDSDHSSCSK